MTMESEADFVEQLRQEELSKDDYNADGGTRTRVDDDGTVSEFDPVKRAWFPMVMIGAERASTRCLSTITDT